MFPKLFEEILIYRCEMVRIKEFRQRNGLTQTELGDYLGMKKSFISKIENGKEKLPQEKFLKLINNPHGWEVHMLIEENNGIINNQSGTHIGGNNTVTMSTGNCALEKENASLRMENEMLKSQLEKAEAEKQEYWEMIKRLTAK